VHADDGKLPPKPRRGDTVLSRQKQKVTENFHNDIFTNRSYTAAMRGEPILHKRRNKTNDFSAGVILETHYLAQANAK
jgi:hypothetical protein